MTCFHAGCLALNIFLPVRWSPFASGAAAGAQPVPGVRPQVPGVRPQVPGARPPQVVPGLALAVAPS